MSPEYRQTIYLEKQPKFEWDEGVETVLGRNTSGAQGVASAIVPTPRTDIVTALERNRERGTTLMAEYELPSGETVEVPIVAAASFASPRTGVEFTKVWIAGIEGDEASPPRGTDISGLSGGF